MNFCEISKNTFFTEYLRWLFLHLIRQNETTFYKIYLESSDVSNLNDFINGVKFNTSDMIYANFEIDYSKQA